MHAYINMGENRGHEFEREWEGVDWKGFMGALIEVSLYQGRKL